MPSPRRRGTKARPRARTRSRRQARIPIAGPIRIVFLDLDGTLTDGVIVFDTVGDQRNFFIRDGLALLWARERGVLPVVISGRGSKAAELRMADLELEHYLDVKDKVAVAERVMAREGVSWKECVMVGDDLPDMAMLERAGWAVAVADAVGEVVAAAHWVTTKPAGRGAVREVMERVLKHNGLWQSVLDHYEVK